MSRSTVIIDGVTLTRQQIEKAVEELNKPDLSRFDHLEAGDRLVYRVQEYVVPDEWTQRALKRAWEKGVRQFEPNRLCLINVSNGTTYTPLKSDMFNYRVEPKA